MIERGIIVDGNVAPGTERVKRTASAWWPYGHHSTRSRLGAEIDLYIQHWTAGHTTHDEDAGPTTFRAMSARKSTKRPGQLMDVAVNFVIGWRGTIWQVADVLTACVHVPGRPTIRRSVSTEHRWPGTKKNALRLGYDDGPWRTVVIGGRKVEIMEPSKEMLEASLWLADALTTIKHPRVRIPRTVPPSNARFTAAQMRAFRGAAEHGQMPSSDKIDCAGLLNDNLAHAGWDRG